MPARWLRYVGTGLVALSAAALAVVVFIAAVFLSDTPQVWTATILAIACFVAMRRSRTTRRRMVWWNCGIVLVIWACLDAGAFLWTGHVLPVVPRAALAMRWADDLPNLLAVRDPLLGYTLPPGGHRQEGDVSYDINIDGLRIGPPSTGTPEGCVLFFGCSFTFGEGVNDNQTFPYLVEVKTLGRFQTRNFAVSGSAPHYALAQVESGMVEHAAHCVPTHAIYLVLPHHLVRVGGKFAARFGPRYQVQPDGSVARSGSFNRTAGEFALALLQYTSGLYVAKFGYESAADGGDVALLVAVLKTLQQRLVERYPGIDFEIIYWDGDPSPIAADLGTQLGGIGVPVHLISEIFRGVEDDRIYLPTDHHPSAWAHDRIADYLATNVLASHD